MKAQLISLYIFLCLATCIFNSASAQNPDDKNWSDRFGYPGIIAPNGTAIATYKDTIYIMSMDNQYSQYRSIIYTSDGKTIKPFKHPPTLDRRGNIRDIGIDSSGHIIITGSFDSVSGVAAKNVAMWNGSNWIPMGKGLYGGQNVGGYTIELLKNEIHVFGLFQYAGDELANSIARWDGNTWHGLDSGFVDFHVEPAWFIASTVLNDSLLCTFGRGPIYGKGISSYADGTVIVWDGNHWSKVPAAVTRSNQDQTYVFGDIAAFDGSIYLSGIFDSIDGIFVNRFARWDGEKWSGMSPNSYSGDISGLSACKEGVYVSAQKYGKMWTGDKWLDMLLPGYESSPGFFFNFGERTFGSTSYPQTNDSTLQHLGLVEIKDKKLYPIIDTDQYGVYRYIGDIHDMVAVGKDIFILGDFIGAGTLKNFKTPIRWDGNKWSRLPSAYGKRGFSHIFSINDTLYATGDFPTINGDSSIGIAKWDGEKWLPVYHPGISKKNYEFGSTITDLSISKKGWLTYINAKGTLVFNNEEKQELARGNISSFSFKDDTLFMIKVVDTIGYLIKWDRISGESLLDSMILLSINPHGDRNPGFITKLVAKDDKIFIVGDFTHIDDKLVNNIAMWDGTTWHSFGRGVSDTGKYLTGAYTKGKPIEDIVFHKDDIYVGGFFARADSSIALSIAKWNGKEWSPLGSGVTSLDDYYDPFAAGVVRAMTIVDDKLYIAGTFNLAGGKNAQNISYYELPPLQSVKKSSASTSLRSPKINPNPTSGIITVTLDEANNEEITVSDVLGRIVKKTTAYSNEITLDCTELPKGTYYLSVGSDGSETRTTKFVLF
ncbi:MAG TPA: T9SS type A sorting domain-containing protein [Candidatus Kapabacteria bacterium]